MHTYVIEKSGKANGPFPVMTNLKITSLKKVIFFHTTE
jgi:hypothetical protein